MNIPSFLLQRPSFTTRASYRPDIDGLRAIAILAVVLFHTFPDWFPGGFPGVDVFFAISGFLITGIILRYFNDDPAPALAGFLSSFYAKRVRRIFPALLFLFIGVSLLGILTMTPPELKSLGRQIKWGAAFSENIYLILTTGGYWDTATEMKPLMHLWTLAVEEQFYILYPFLCWFLLKRKFLFIPLLGLCLVSFVLNVLQVHAHPISTFYSLHTRFWEIGLGGILACAFSGKRCFPSCQNLHSVVGMILIGAAFCLFNDSLPYPGWAALLPAGGACLLLSTPHAWLNRKILAQPILVFVGLISYTWYLWHWPLLAISRCINGGTLPDAPIRLLLLLAGFVLSLFSFYCVELPVRTKPASGKTPWLAAALCSCCLLVVFGGRIAAVSATLFAGRTDASLAKQAVNTAVPRLPACQDEYRYPGDYCWSSGRGKNKVAVIGDSHAFHLASGFRANRVPFVLLGQPGTSPLPGLVKPDQEDWKEGDPPNTSRLYEAVLSDPDIATVVLSSGWNALLSPKRNLVWTEKAHILDRKERIKALLMEGIEKFLSSGKKVILMEDVPIIGFSPFECFNSRLLLPANNTTCGITLDEAIAHSQEINTLLAEVYDALSKEYEGKIFLYDPKNVLCPGGFCASVSEGSVYYTDRDHLSDTGSVRVVTDLISANKSCFSE